MHTNRSIMDIMWASFILSMPRNEFVWQMKHCPCVFVCIGLYSLGIYPHTICPYNADYRVPFCVLMLVGVGFGLATGFCRVFVCLCVRNREREREAMNALRFQTSNALLFRGKCISDIINNTLRTVHVARSSTECVSV